MTYDLALALRWHPDDVRRLTIADVVGLSRAGERAERRTSKGRR
jgi:hypothetical protein